MGADTRTRRFSEETIRQVRLDGKRALIRARFCPDRSEIIHLRCVDDRAETDTKFGNQLWYFEALACDEQRQQHTVFGVVEYSTQFGLNELVDDGVYDSGHQREKFRHLYEREVIRPSWNQPAHRWLAAGVIAVASAFLAFILVRMLTL